MSTPPHPPSPADGSETPSAGPYGPVGSPQGQYGPGPGGYGPPPGYGPPAGYGPIAGYGPPAPFGYGYGPPPEYSHRTKTAAGLLQLLPGLLIALGGIGRCYTGHVALGVVHIVLSVIGWATAPFLIGIPIVAACWLWAVVDGIVLLAGTPRDADGRLLR